MPCSASICQSYFRFWPILSTPRSSSSGLSAASASVSAIWSGASPAPNKPSPPPSACGGRAARSRPRSGATASEKPTSSPASDRAAGLGVDRDHAGLDRARDPGASARSSVAHDLVGRAVDRALRAASRARAAASEAGVMALRAPARAGRALAGASSSRRRRSGVASSPPRERGGRRAALQRALVAMPACASGLDRARVDARRLRRRAASAW